MRRWTEDERARYNARLEYIVTALFGIAIAGVAYLGMRWMAWAFSIAG